MVLRRMNWKHTDGPRQQGCLFRLFRTDACITSVTLRIKNQSNVHKERKREREKTNDASVDLISPVRVQICARAAVTTLAACQLLVPMVVLYYVQEPEPR